MQTCVSSYSLKALRREERLSLLGLIDRVAALADAACVDVRGVEIAAAPELEGDDALAAAKRVAMRARKRGLAVPSLCVGAELLVPEKKQKAQVRSLLGCLEAAEAMGAGVMRFDVSRGFDGKHAQWWDGPRTIKRLIDHVTPAIREVADAAAQRGMTVTVENHGFYLQTPARIAKLLDAVDHEHYGLTLDMGNWLCLDEDPVAATQALADRATFVHAKDFYRRPVKQQPAADPQIGSGWFVTDRKTALRGAVLGHGDIDVAAQFAALKKAGYDGWVSLEFEGIEPADKGVRLGLATLQALCGKSVA